MTKIKIAVLLGSLRKQSFTKAVVEALINQSPKEMEYEILEIGRAHV